MCVGSFASTRVEALLDVVLLAGRVVSVDTVEEVELERPNEFANGAK
jgi:hypothetical protein